MIKDLAIDNIPGRKYPESKEIGFDKNIGSSMSACSSAVKIYMHLDDDSFVNEEINAKTNNLIETSTLRELISDMTDYTPLAG